MPRGAIPIKDARELGTKRQCPVIVIFGIEENQERYTITTWGKTKKLCAWAAKIGNDIHNAVTRGEILDAAHEENPYERIKHLEEQLHNLQEKLDALHQH